MTKERIRYQNFDALNVPLHGNNLIEASAGTGKTYSIALLMLRLLVEEHIAINQVLMVTFTKAAVAELNERIRMFVKLAQAYAHKNTISDEAIMTIVQRAMEKHPEKTKEVLDQAVLLLDETAIMTIHSFCQQTLTEFAFETKQLFGAEMYPDTKEIIEKEVNNFWRQHITTLTPEILQLLDYHNLRASIIQIVTEHLSGKRYRNYESNKIYDLSSLSTTLYNEELDNIRQQSKALVSEVNRTLYALQEEIINILTQTRTSKHQKALLASIDEPEQFLNILKAAGNTWLEKMPAQLIQIINETDKYLKNAAGIVSINFKETVYYFAISEVEKAIQQFMATNNYLSYNDLIKNLNKALTRAENNDLVTALQAKYKALFVDEFQDTDKEQYEIFDIGFKGLTTFYIGDPKQSIYAWRMADMATYFEARNSVQNVYDMDTNYRSTESIIHAMNHFFKPHNQFDTFHFNHNRDGIIYTPVKSPKNNPKEGLIEGEKNCTSITITKCKNKDEISWSVALEIANLLFNTEFAIKNSGLLRAVKPSDIGILVRNKNESTAIKNHLNYLGIAAVNLQDELILSTEEAQEVYYLITAIFQPNMAHINRALLSNLTGFNENDISHLDIDLITEMFITYKSTWTEKGIYPAMMQFAHDFGLAANYSSESSRSIANFYQIVEVLEQESRNRNMSQEELIYWLRRGIDGELKSGDEYTQRMESDEEAVKISTIHKSKGLEYNIVFAPFLNLRVREDFKFVTYQHPETKYYHYKEMETLTEEELQWYKEQQEQENRRLIYVAVTRSVFKCYIYQNTYHLFNATGLTQFVKALEDNPKDDIVEISSNLPQLNNDWQNQAQKNTKTQNRLLAQNFKLSNEHWEKMSYSKLAEHSSLFIQKERIAEHTNEYDTFIFNTLKAGTSSGNMLHYLLEHIDFTAENSWKRTIDVTIQNYISKDETTYSKGFQELLYHAMNTNIRIDGDSFKLKEIPKQKRINELEFDFPISKLVTEQLNQLSSEHFNIGTKPNNQKAVDGLMNGKIDLFFEHNNKYYILDWKSNYLGYNPELHYHSEALQNAMNENNYHLQYLIYSVAIKKYLSSRLGSFNYETQFGGVIYLFLRGIRKDHQYGIFTTKPTLEIIERTEQILQQ